MDNLQETLSQEIQDIKFKQDQMQNTVTNKKFPRSNRQQNTGGRRMNKRGGGQTSGNHGCRTEKRKKIETNEESLRELWDNIKCTYNCIIGVPEGEERGKETE